MSSDVVRVRREVLVKMREEATKTPEQECCGVLAGRGGIITEIFSARNVHPDPASAYEIAPQDLFRIVREIRAHEMQMLGIYHSHPTGKNRPSRTDIDRAFYPDVPYFILSPLPDSPHPVRAFLIRDDEVTELKTESI